MDFKDVSDSDLRRELQRREEDRNKAEWTALNERVGPCPDCGALLRTVEAAVVEEFFDAPDWQGWPAEPPPYMKRYVGGKWETALTCENGHVRYETNVRYHEVAAREP